MIDTFEPRDVARVKGRIRAVILGPNGEVKYDETADNIITQIGRRYYAGRAAGVAGAEGQVTGMKLGQDSATVAAVVGAGAALVSYIAGSHRAIDGGFPTESAQGNGSRVTWQATWPAGTVVNTDIEEVALVNDALADAVSAAADTIGRVIIPTANKGNLDSLIVTWTHDLGA